VQECLIPEDVGWPKLVAFLSAFDDVQDNEVSPRYHYGQLRLTRLNWWAMAALGEWTFQKTRW
jgi:hypothetical protein